MRVVNGNSNENIVKLICYLCTSLWYNIMTGARAVGTSIRYRLTNLKNRRLYKLLYMCILSTIIWCNIDAKTILYYSSTLYNCNTYRFRVFGLINSINLTDWPIYVYRNEGWQQLVNRIVRVPTICKHFCGTGKICFKYVSGAQSRRKLWNLKSFLIPIDDNTL